MIQSLPVRYLTPWICLAMLAGVELEIYNPAPRSTMPRRGTYDQNA